LFIKKTLLQEFLDFQDFPGPTLIFQDFPVLKNARIKFQDFPEDFHDLYEPCAFCGSSFHDLGKNLLHTVSLHPGV